MHALHSKQPVRDASVNIGRRTLLATAALGALAAAGVASAADGGETGDHLLWLIDAHREAVREEKEIGRRQAAIIADAACPDEPEVAVSEIGARWEDYHDMKRLHFEDVRDVNRYFSELIDAERGCGNTDAFPGWLARISADRRRLLDLFQARADARDKWFFDMGFDSLDDELERCVDRQCDLEREIADYPCRCRRDIALKIEFAEIDLKAQSGYGQHFVDMLASMKEFAEAHDA